MNMQNNKIQNLRQLIKIHVIGLLLIAIVLYGVQIGFGLETGDICYVGLFLIIPINIHLAFITLKQKDSVQRIIKLVVNSPILFHFLLPCFGKGLMSFRKGGYILAFLAVSIFIMPILYVAQISYLITLKILKKKQNDLM